MATSDRTLVLGALNGDRSAFAELYDRRARLIRAICYDATGDMEAACDLTQEVFLRAWRNLERIRDPQRFARWLVGIARQVCREWHRQRIRERRRLAEYARQQPTAAAELPDERLEAVRRAIAGLTACEQRALPSLSDRERLALHAYYLQGRRGSYPGSNEPGPGGGTAEASEKRTRLTVERAGCDRVLSSDRAGPAARDQ